MSKLVGCFLFVKIIKTIAYNTFSCYNVDIGKEVMPLKKLRKKIKKWLPLVIAIIQLATAVITAINKE